MDLARSMNSSIYCLGAAYISSEVSLQTRVDPLGEIRIRADFLGMLDQLQPIDLLTAYLRNFVAKVGTERLECLEVFSHRQINVRQPVPDEVATSRLLEPLLYDGEEFATCGEHQVFVEDILNSSPQILLPHRPAGIPK